MVRKPKSEHDFAVNAFRVVQEATNENIVEPKKNFDAKALGRKGGLKGGKARANKLTPEQRKEIARVAAQTRWKKSA